MTRSPRVVTPLFGLPLLVFVVLAAAFAIPGPCAFNPHDELDCDDGQRCPDGLACAADGHCQPADVACDGLDEDDFPGGAVACNGLCVASASFASDAENCGACGNVCSAGLGCCDGDCVSLDVDDRCGACGVTCNAANRETCIDAACRASCSSDTDCDLAAGELCCGDVCRAGNVDERCGACDVACTSGELCVDQTCRALCADDGDCPGSHCCGDPAVCVAAGDPEHCGGCDSPCGEDFVCLDDACAPECAADRPCTDGSACCDGRCVNTASDDDHCGSCDAPCAGATFCNDSTCHDGTEDDCCGTNCSDCLAAGDICSGGTCRRCDMYLQDCGPDHTCEFAPGRIPPDGRCVPVGIVDPPSRFEECVDIGGQADCEAGNTCLRANSTTTVCTRFCDPNTLSGCASGENCAVQDVPGTGGFVIGFCAPACEADSNVACNFASLPGTCVPPQTLACELPLDGLCAVSGAGGVGTPCQVIPDCAQGLICDPSRSVCDALCTNHGGACPTGGTCQPLLGPECVGVCQP